jgi:ribosomal protein L11 methyltransferase
MSRSWLETRVAVPREAAEVVASYLIDAGSPGLVTEEAGERIELVAYFDGEEQVEAVRLYLRQHAIEASVRVARIGEENWAENWKEHFPPLAVGERLYLCPPWAAAPLPGRTTIVIDPGMAFGTGHHATTRACLELLERYVEKDCRVLDVGTGSGVLSIAALLLGAGRAVGVDTDPLATAAAAENAERNGVAARLSLHASLDDVDGRFDLAVANIQLNVLCDLERGIAARVRPGGTLVASGLLREELDAWRQRYAEDWELGDTAGDAQWVAIAARRRAGGRS